MARSTTWYAGGSDHGSDTSYGFSNDWYVWAFDSRKARDKYVEEVGCTNISIRPIAARDVTAHLRDSEETTAQTGYTWYIVDVEFCPGYNGKRPDGFVGAVERHPVCPSWDRSVDVVRRLYPSA